jgi:hypothetical protein
MASARSRLGARTTHSRAPDHGVHVVNVPLTEIISKNFNYTSKPEKSKVAAD